MQLCRVRDFQAWLKSKKTSCIEKRFGLGCCSFTRFLLVSVWHRAACTHPSGNGENGYVLVLIEFSRTDVWTEGAALA